MSMSSPIINAFRNFRGTTTSPDQRGVWARREWSVVGVSGVALVSAWVMVVTGFPIGADQVVTHYSIPFGIDGIGPWWQVWLLPAAASVLTLAHLFVIVPWVRARLPKVLPLVWAGTIVLNLAVAWAVLLLRYQQLPT